MDPPVAPTICASVTPENRAACADAVPVAFADRVMDVPEMAVMVALCGALTELTYIPIARPEALPTVAAGLPLVVVSVVVICEMLAAVPPMSSLPMALRPLRFGILNVVNPSPLPHG